MNYLAQVNDIGDYYQINFTTSESGLNVGNEYLPLNNITSEQIDKLLSEGNNISVLKGIKRELLPADLIVSKNESDISNKYVHKLNKLIDTHNTSLSSLDLFNYIHNQQILNSYQYFINDDNMYKIYMEIASTNNIVLIEALEYYIVSESKCSTLVNRINEINRAIIEVRNATTEEQMKLICDSQVFQSSNIDNVIDILVIKLRNSEPDYVKTIAKDFGIKINRFSEPDYLIDKIKEIFTNQQKHEDEIRKEINQLSFENNSYFNLIKLRDNLKDINARIKDSEYLKNSLETTLDEYEKQLSNVINTISIQKSN